MSGSQTSNFPSAAESLLDMVYYRDERMPPGPPPYSIRRAFYNVRQDGLVGALQNAADAVLETVWVNGPRFAAATEDEVVDEEDEVEAETEEDFEPTPTKKKRRVRKRKKRKRQRPRRRRRRKYDDRMRRRVRRRKYHRPMRSRRRRSRWRRRRP